MLSSKKILQAEALIRPYVRETWLEPSPLGKNVFVKLENLQRTGSFKVRGAMNKLLSIKDEEKARGVITASTGNHGAAVAYGLKTLGIKGSIVVPETASSTKVEAIRRLGAEVQLHGDDGVIAERYARAQAEENGITYISPYNDLEVVAGQGSIGVELSRQREKIDTVFVALGGGGLISGIATYLKSVSSEVNVIACSPQNAAVMLESVKAGEILELESKPTLSDGTAGGVEEDAVTFELVRNLVDNYITVSEREIKEGIKQFMNLHHMLIEGAAGVVVAAYLKERQRLEGKTVVLIICGANIGLEALKQVLT